jgi:hypothetical protein
MALEEVDHRLFVVTRKPARLLVLDTPSGKPVASSPTVGDADDAFYDSARKRIYVSGGEGFIDIFEQDRPDQYQCVGRIPTASGADILVRARVESSLRGSATPREAAGRDSGVRASALIRPQFDAGR